jgi:hypothetical protein
MRNFRTSVALAPSWPLFVYERMFESSEAPARICQVGSPPHLRPTNRRARPRAAVLGIGASNSRSNVKK